MKLLLINLSLRPEGVQCIFPIGIGYIATAVKEAGYEFDVLDMDIHKLKPEQVIDYPWQKYNVIAFGCIVTGYKIVKELSAIIKLANPNAMIICGNSVASSIPDILLDNTDVDVAVIGEGDKAIVDILRQYCEIGKFRGKWKGKAVKDINELPLLDWDIFDMHKYIAKNKSDIPEPHIVGYAAINAMPINSARGCIHRCTFCYQVFCDDLYRYRSIDSIGKEIDILKQKYDINYITFYDDLTLFNKQRVDDFIAMLTNKGIFWTACCRADLFLQGGDLGQARRLKQSGCTALGYSLESANADILKSMNKRISLEGFRQQKAILDEVGIATLTSLVIGYPQETEATLKETFDFCYANNMYPSTGYLLPQPGTPMYAYAVANGYILDEEAYLMAMGDRQDLRLNMTKIPDARLEKLVHSHLRRIRDKLHLKLTDKQLIKTGVVRQEVK